MWHIVFVLPDYFCIHGTFVSEGLKLGLPCTEAPCKIVIVVAPGTAQGEVSSILAGH